MTVRIELNRDGVAEILKSAGVLAELERRAHAIAAAAGDGFVVESSTGRSRARVRVYADTFEAKRAEAKDRALTRAIDAGRG